MCLRCASCARAHLTVPLKRSGAWGMSERRERSACRFTPLVSWPSTRTAPPRIGRSLKSTEKMLDLPAPVLPATATCTRSQHKRDGAARGRKQQWV